MYQLITTKKHAMTKKAAKLEIAKANREAIITRINSILAEANSYMTLKTAMEVFLGAQVNSKVTDKDFADFVLINGYRAVRLAAQRAVKKDRYAFLSEAAQRQMPSSWR